MVADQDLHELHDAGGIQRLVGAVDEGADVVVMFVADIIQEVRLDFQDGVQVKTPYVEDFFDVDYAEMRLGNRGADVDAT